MIPCTAPTIVSSTAAVTYGFWWIVGININAADAANVSGTVTLRKCYSDANGGPVYSPEPAVQFTINQIMQDPDPSMQAAVIALMNAVAVKAAGLNIL